jgi:hypothetical protein
MHIDRRVAPSNPPPHWWLPCMLLLLLSSLVSVAAGAITSGASADPAASSAGDARSQEIEVLEELLDSDLPGTQPRNQFELVIDPNYSDAVNGDFIRITPRVRYGLTDHWEIFAELLTFVNHPINGNDEGGVGDLSLGTKYRWKRWLRPHLDVATGFSLQIPLTDNDDLSDGVVHYLPYMTFSRRLRGWSHMVVATQIGFDILQSSPDREPLSNELQDTSFFLAPSATVQISPFSVFVESKWETTEISGGTRNNVFITPGFLLDLPRLGQRLGRWRIGFGVRFGLADADDSFTFLTRIKLDIGLKWASKKQPRE